MIIKKLFTRSLLCKTNYWSFCGNFCFLIILSLLSNFILIGVANSQSSSLRTGNLIKTYAPLCSDTRYFSSSPGTDICHSNPTTYCSNLTNSNSLKKIGEDCIVKLPTDCKSLSSGNPGINCIDYDIFSLRSLSGKRLSPKSCYEVSGGVRGSDCLNFSFLSYCHEVTEPILGINCRLAPCNAISNFFIRRPGINCLADCNEQPGNSIKESSYYFEGLNCLRSCKTTANPNPGVNCIYEFNDYVTPLCTKGPISKAPSDVNNYGATKDYLLENRTQSKPRVSCVDLINLPICNQGTSSINCTTHCNDPNIHTSNGNCIAFQGENFKGDLSKVQCHHYLSLSGVVSNLGSCEKISCNLLTPQELSQSTAMASPQTEHCEGKLVKCSEFSENQIKEATLVTHCQPIDCLCSGSSVNAGLNFDYSKIKRLDSFFTSYSANYLKSCVNSFGSNATGFDNYPCCNPVTCLQTDATATLQCTINNGVPQVNPKCDSGSTCSNNTCQKTHIDCNIEENKNDRDLSVCQQTYKKIPTDDPYVSWFFRPTPLPKSLKTSNQKLTLREMSGYPIDGKGSTNDSIYYTVDQMKANGWGIFTPLIWTHDASGIQIFGDQDSRSPRGDSDNWYGTKLQGIQGICRNKSVWDKPNDDFGYFKGNVKTTYTDEGATHKVTLCTRFKNSGVAGVETCGTRECGIYAGSTVFGSSVSSNWCGSDECVEVTIDDSKPQDCRIVSDSDNKECAKKINSDNGQAANANIRVRAYKPNDQNYVCGVLDYYSTKPVNSNFYDGVNQKFILENNREECVTGTLNNSKTPSTCEGGIDSNESESDMKWRTVQHFRYIDDVSNLEGIPSGKSGIIARINYKTPSFFEKSDCIKHNLRVGTPVYFNLSTKENSPKLFTPPLYIIRTCKSKDINCEKLRNDLSPTDFYEPMIEVGYGEDASSSVVGDTDHKLIAVDFNKKQEPSKQNQYITLTTTKNAFVYTAEVYLTKQDGDNPKACLYRKVKVGNAYSSQDELIGCVLRKKPLADNSTSPNELLRKTQLTTSSSSYDDFSVSLKYLFSKSIRAKIDKQRADCSNSEVSCSNSNKITFLENLYNTKTSVGEENFSLEVTRDRCSRLNFECIKNQLSLNQSLREHSITSYEAENDNTRTACNSLLAECNQRKNISVSSLNPSNKSGFNQKAKGLYYGWFNEICITSGFEDELNKNVIAYIPKTANGYYDYSQMGKCLTEDPTKCPEGGKKPDCSCLEMDSSEITGTTIRKITPREAGLCVDIVIPKSCPAIEYPSNSNPENKYFTSQYDIENIDSDSLKYGKFYYPHTLRSGDQITDENLNSYSNLHAEFGFALQGENLVIGKCNGFWKPSSYLGHEVYPTASCMADGTWSKFQNSCQRYSCPQRITSQSGCDSNGLYPDYDISGNPSQLGENEGFANWKKYTKTNDLRESTTAQSCLIGYKPESSNQIKNNNISVSSIINYYNSSSTEIKRAIDSMYKETGGYSGGYLPKRECDQLGNWRKPFSSCERIYCSRNKILPQTSINFSPGNQILDYGSINNLWGNVNGIIVDKDTPASRSNDPAIRLDESLATGECLQNLGYFPLSSTVKPKLYCDYNGNWSYSIYPCQSSCSAVYASGAGADKGNGNATWLNYSASFSNIKSPVTSNRCQTGYYPYPYPPMLDEEGETGDNGQGAVPVNLVQSGNDYLINTSTNSRRIKVQFPVTNSTDYPKIINGIETALPIKKIDSNRQLKSLLINDLETSATYILTKTDQAWVKKIFVPNKLSEDPRMPYSSSLPIRSCVWHQMPDGTSKNSWTLPNSFCINGCVGSDQDNRIGAGTTEHRVSFQANPLKISWENEDFGKWQTVAYEGYSLSKTSHTASDYRPNRNNGKFTLSRFCNPTTKKWDDPIILCATNNGTVDENDKASLTYKIATATQTKPSGFFSALGDEIEAKCNAVPNGTDFEYDFELDSGGNLVDLKTLKYTCQFKDSNQFIDQVYFNKTSGSSCIQTCNSDTLKLYGSAAIDKINYDSSKPYTKKYRSGQTLKLSCTTGYGNKDSGISRTVGNNEDKDQLCSITKNNKTTRIADSPSVSCNDGSWTEVSNVCEKCKSCTPSSPVKAFIIDESGGGNANYEAVPSKSYTLKSSYTAFKIKDGSGQKEKITATPLPNRIKCSRFCRRMNYFITFDANGESDSGALYVNPVLDHGITSQHRSRTSKSDCPWEGQYNVEIYASAAAKCFDGELNVGLYCNSRAGGAGAPIVE